MNNGYLESAQQLRRLADRTSDDVARAKILIVAEDYEQRAALPPKKPRGSSTRRKLPTRALQLAREPFDLN